MRQFTSELVGDVSYIVLTALQIDMAPSKDPVQTVFFMCPNHGNGGGSIQATWDAAVAVWFLW